MNAVAVFDPNSSSNSGKISGKVSFHQCTPSNQTIVRVELKGFKPNTIHGFHIHRLGDLSKGCTSLCEHYNVDPSQMHGSIELYGRSRHTGDMCSNVIADKNGNVSLIHVDELIDIFPPHSILGRSVVIHEKEDDLGKYRYENSKRGELSRTTGDAGSRIACAVIGLSE